MSRELDKRTPTEIAESILDELVKEYGDETFIPSGYGFGDDMLEAVASAIEDARLQASKQAFEEAAAHFDAMACKSAFCTDDDHAAASWAASECRDLAAAKKTEGEQSHNCPGKCDKAAAAEKAKEWAEHALTEERMRREKFEVEARLAEKVVDNLRRGSCWCEVAIGNPMMKGHTWTCLAAQEWMKSKGAE